MAHIRSAKPVHLLWALYLMQTYATEENMISLFGGVDEKNMRKWFWFYTNGMSDMASKVLIF